MTNSNQKERFRTRIAMQEQNITVLQNKCEEYLAEISKTKQALNVAVDALNSGKTLADIAGFKMLVAGLEKALNEIKQITEKKDVK